MARLTKKAKTTLTAHIGAQQHERLVELLLEQAETDNALRDRLLLEAADAGEGVDPSSYRRSFAEALRSGSAARRDGPRTSGAWAGDVHEVIGRIDDLLRAGHAAEVVGITEYALGRIDKAMSRVDDSSGWFAEILSSVERTHHDACAAAGVDPVVLARRLFALEVDTEWDILIDSAQTYQDLLGDDGLAEMQRLATERWKALPPAEVGPFRHHADGEFHLTRVMETLADLAGDVDARVEVMARDLAYPYDYVEIAKVLLEAGRPADAQTWAERGLTAFDGTDHPRPNDSRLDDLVLAGWLEQGRTADVVDLVRQRFDAAPGLSTYQRLKEWSVPSGVWDQERARALALFRDDADERLAAVVPPPIPLHNRFGPKPPPPTTHDRLVEVLAWDGELDQAWALATEHGCSVHLWNGLAAAREADHPLDAISVYEREVERQVGQKTTHTYETAIARIAHIGTLYEQAGDPASFTAYVADVRHRHRAKTKFLKLLGQAALAGDLG
mgnify:CR=1 FL=1